MVPPSRLGRDHRTWYARPSRSTTAVPEPVDSAYGGGIPYSRNRDVRTTVYWITTVAAPRSPPAASRDSVPSIHTSQRWLRADQRKVNAAAGYDTLNEVMARPPGGAGPNRKPMSCAVLAPAASPLSVLPYAYRLCGAYRLRSRKYADVSY